MTSDRLNSKKTSRSQSEQAGERRHLMEGSPRGAGMGPGRSPGASAGKPEERPGRGTILVGLAAATAAPFAQLGGIASIQLMNQIPPDFELNALRFGVGMIFSVSYLILTQTLPRVSRDNIKWLAIVCVTTFGYNLSLFSHNLKRMPIVTLLCVMQTFRIILTLIFSKLFLKHEIPVVKFVICVATVIGSILTVIPRVEVYLQYSCASCIHAGNSEYPQNVTAGNNTDSTLFIKPKEDNTTSSIYLSNNDYRLNNTSLDHTNTSQCLDLNNTDLNINSNGHDLSSSDLDLNNSGRDLNSSDRDLNSSDLDLNNSDHDLNNSNHDLNNSKQVFDYSDHDFGNSKHDITEFLVSLAVIFVAALCSTTEATVISGSPLRDANTVVFSFWYFLIASLLSLGITFLLEEPFIPRSQSDVLLCFGHSVGASAVTYLDLVALQILDINVYVIIITLRLPVAMVMQLTVLRRVIPVTHVMILAIGMMITLITSVTMPIYQYCFVDRNKKDAVCE